MSGQALISSFVHKNFTIDISEHDNLSDIIDVTGLVLIGLELPDTWTTSDITLLASVRGDDEDDLKSVCDEDGTAVTFAAVAQDKLLMVSATSPMLAGFTHMRISSTTNQAQDVVVRAIFGVVNP